MGEEDSVKHTDKKLERERFELLVRVERALEIPMVVLGFIWLLLLIIELIWGLGAFLQLLSTTIWIIFILDFLLKFWLAPHKIQFLKKNVLTTISLIIPALRVFRLARIFRVVRSVRAARGLRLVKVVGSLNRGMKSLGGTMSRNAFGYVLALTLVVVVTGAAGMYAFENEFGLKTYGESLWWTVMLLTSIGSDYFPKTAEGRVLCFLLAVYGFAVFGYFTATLASLFSDRDASSSKSEVAGASQVRELQREMKLLRAELQQALQQQAKGQNDPPAQSQSEV
jgi:voltage-gated potassium channel